MSFAAAGWLLVAAALPPVMALGWWLMDRARSRALERLARPETLGRLVRPESTAARRARRLATTAGLVLLTVALARPRWGESATTISRTGVDVVFVVDASLSMTAEDMRPSRLARARTLLGDLALAFRGHRLGLVSFAGGALALCPLTLDDQAVLLFADAVEPGNVPRLGTHLGEGIRTAAGLFSTRERKFKVMVLLTDGEDHEGEALSAVEEAAAQGIVVHTVGFGSREGEPIPQRDDEGQLAGYKKDAEGRVVLTRLNAELLENLAARTGGVTAHAARAEQAVETLVAALESMERRHYEALSARRLVERFQLFVALALLLLAVDPLVRCMPGRLRPRGGRA